MSTYKNLMTFGCVAALALGLAACGGGGSSTPAANNEPDPPDPQMACEAAGGSWDGSACTSAAELRTAATEAIDEAEAAVDAVMDDSNDATVAAADAAIATAEAAVMAASGHGASDLAMQKGRLAEKKDSRMMAMDAKDTADKKAMMATAAKLYAGISAQSGAGDNSTFAETDRDAYYNNTGTAILVTIGDGTTAPTEASATLSEDKKTPIADNHGWKGKRYIDPAGGDSYEAVVYSNVEPPKQGRKFGGAAAGEEFEYTLGSGMVAIPSSGGFVSGTNDATAAQVAARVGGSSFDHSAGVKRFPLPDPNPNAATVVTVSGTFHGVSGTYSCTPAAAVCAARVVDGGFELGTVPSATDATFTASDTIWTFRPSSASARVTSGKDTAYASYGWWLKKAANNGPFTASAFVDEKGTVADASGLDALNGKATYMGGAAGKYALSSALPGGTNDAGHFTARATLEANFTNNTAATAITGTIDQFMGADGMERDWSVKLNASDIGDTGGIGNAGDGTDAVHTVWTIGGTAAKASGNWTGNLRNNGSDGVPKVATGTFYTEYGTAGRMVGAFGANKQ